MGDKSLLERIEALENLLILEPCTINSSRIGKNADDDEATQLLECQLREDNDVQTIEEMHIPGVQYNPPVDSRGFFSKCWEELKVLVGVNDRIPKVSLVPGERIAYASASGAIVCSIKYNADGSLDVTAPGDINMIGNLNVTGNIECDSEIIADLEITAGFASVPIEVTQHPHLGNLGYNTSAPVVTGGGVSKPGNAPTYDSGDSTIDFETVGVKNVGTMSQNVEAHTHTQPNDGGGDIEQPTNPPA